MNIGDTIIRKGGQRFVIDKFTTLADEPGVILKSINGTGITYGVLKCYLEYYVGSGIFILKKNTKTKKRRKTLKSRKKKL